MELERCPACGWPAPKGRSCPRGCGAVTSETPAPLHPSSYFAAPPPGHAPPATETPALYPATERRVSRRRAGPAGIGGLLLLPVIGLILTICWNAWSIYHDLLPFRRSEAWTALTTPGSDIYHWLWQPLALFEVFTAIVMVITPIVLLVLIFRRRRSARGCTIAFYAFCCVAAAVDSVAGLLFMTEWLRSIGLDEAASAISTNALYSLYQVAVLAAVWIPYLLLSRRVKNTFVNPALAAQANPAGRLRGALAVLLIVVIAGTAVYAFNTRLAAAGTAAATSASSESEQIAQQADAALLAGDWNQAIGLYAQAIQADPGYGPAYYGQWTALLQREDLGQALEVAMTITQRFSDSRQAWFVLGYTQEAQGDMKAAASSYTNSLARPQIPAASGTPITDATVQQRLDLVSYVTAITEPRVAIAAAVNEVNTALQGATPDATSLSGAATQVTTVLTSNIAELAKITPPAYFAAFHSGMLTAYDALESACAELAATVSSPGGAALASARESLNEAIDGFNRNDAIGTTLINDYYGQEPPIALVRPAGSGS